MVDDIYTKPLAYPIPTDKPISVQTDLVYRSIGATELKMDVYAPAGLTAGARRPAVLFIHGGPISPDLALMPKDWGVYKSYGALAATSNLVGVTFNHRFFARNDLATAAGDVDAAIQFVRESAARFHIDPERLCLWGFSGGGPLLAFALRERLPFIRCWLAFYARLDLRNLPARDAALLSAEEVRQFSTILALEAGTRDVPMFVARAGQDHPRLNETIDAFVLKALAMNRTLAVMNHPNGQHAFDILTEDARTVEIIDAALAFVKNHG